jgi:mRNA-degrading endonuclease YafQ of YafQ-DinJ toxin-antitoxin module
MNFKIEFSKSFEKKYRKIVKKNTRVKKKIDNIIHLLSQNPRYPSLKSHIIQHTKHG